ncbi:hypothetical protein [Paraflavitalea pollutisoli]|uniref:hypothetical protein n=1 Tax=Paraflavitalea pollutisoli TaxID=3034143 RepID=UPI0023EB0DCA|nr:hypothetical protein [Paraflavitalea sp. H1-2-19X]
MKQDAIKALKILHLSIAGSLVAGILVLALVADGPVVDAAMGRTLQAVSVVLSVGVIWMGFNLFKRKLLAARNSSEAGPVRLSLFRTAYIIWWAMIELPGLFAAICFFLTGNYAFLVLAGFHAILLLLFRPRKANIIVLLRLTSDDVAMLEGKG